MRDGCEAAMKVGEYVSGEVTWKGWRRGWVGFDLSDQFEFGGKMREFEWGGGNGHWGCWGGARGGRVHLTAELVGFEGTR